MGIDDHIIGHGETSGIGVNGITPGTRSTRDGNGESLHQTTIRSPDDRCGVPGGAGLEPCAARSATDEANTPLEPDELSVQSGEGEKGITIGCACEGLIDG